MKLLIDLIVICVASAFLGAVSANAAAPKSSPSTHPEPAQCCGVVVAGR